VHARATRTILVRLREHLADRRGGRHVEIVPHRARRHRGHDGQRGRAPLNHTRDSKRGREFICFLSAVRSTSCAHRRYGTNDVQVACWQPTAGPKRDVPTLDVRGLKIAVRVTLSRFSPSLWIVVRERSLRQLDAQCRASSAPVRDLLDAPTALAACFGFDLCHMYILYLFLYLYFFFL
jgi:hypothetical protein